MRCAWRPSPWSGPVDPLSAGPDPEGRAHGLARGSRGGPGLDHRTRAGCAAGVEWAGASGFRCRRRGGLEAGPRVGGEYPHRRHHLLSEVKESTRRISELVAAVKSYSQMDRASMQRARPDRRSRHHPGDARPPTERRGHGRRATTAPTCPRIEAYPGELNQVWTNLIDNAIDAMDGEGRCGLRTARRRPVVVEIADTGPGMPPEVVEASSSLLHDQGRRRGAPGSGSTSPAASWSERHGGTITIESEPGSTVMRVTLPTTSLVP